LPGLQHIDDLTDRIFNDLAPEAFRSIALDVFQYQYGQNKVYRNYVSHLGVNVDEITELSHIPFMPIGFFKSHEVVSGDFQPEIRFTSSGTTGMHPASHYVKSLALYDSCFFRTFRQFYGNPEDYCILALLPSYLEREGSSLVYMADQLIRRGQHPLSGFFLDEHQLLAERLSELNEKVTKTLLIGVAFALLDFAIDHPMDLGNNITIMETGGMKGRKEEITREELHEELKKAFGLSQIHSEYGMTELLSQAYSKGNGLFFPPPWMKVMIRDIQDPFSYLTAGRSGGINIIDLANIHSCSFIETQDIGRLHPDGGFDVLGRSDHSDIRGCSLLIQ
jgi:phenylacetate-coenzyme A ligase PaaK-like adenylate-forming protein